MGQFQLCLALFGFGFITLTNSQCLVDVQNGTVINSGSACASYSDSILNNTLNCSGINPTNQENLNNLKRFTDAAFDLYNLLRSGIDISLVISSINSIRNGTQMVASLSNAGFARLLFQLKLSPYLSSLSKETLSCLSQSNLSCQSFQALVRDLSTLIGPERKKMVYQNLIKSYLARNTTEAGCGNTTDEQWLLLNFQTFSSDASLKDFKTLKPDFNGLNVLRQLTPEQRADLTFDFLTFGTLSNETVNQILQSFLLPLQNITLNITRENSYGTDKNLTDFLALMKPFGRFIKSSVIIVTNTSNITNNVTQLLNWTLSSLSQNTSILSLFNSSNINDWLQYVFTPVVQKFLLANQTLPNINSAINNIVLVTDPEPTVPVEVCRVTSNNSSCPISQTENSVGKLITCVASVNLNLTEGNLQQLITALSKPLMNQSIENSSSSQNNLTALFRELPAESFTSTNLADVEFMKFWFQTKMIPLLPTVPGDFLSCLSARDFSCQVYRALVVGFSNNTGLMNNSTQRQVYNNFILSFLSRHKNSGGDCTLPFNNSLDFILQNFGSFSSFAQLQDFYNMSSNFSALDALPVLSLVQLNDLVFTPPARAGDRNEILRRVFDFLLPASNRDKLNNFLPALQTQARRLNFSCEDYRNIFDRVDWALSSVLPNQTEALLTVRDSLMMIPPDECIERASQCTTTPVNGRKSMHCLDYKLPGKPISLSDADVEETAICAGVNSSAVDQFLNGVALNATGSQNVCNFSILQFACLPTLSRLNPQQVADLLACKLPSNVTKEIWKLFFTKIGTQLDDALQRYSNMTPSHSNFSLSDVLDVIVDVRINRFSPQRLRDPVFFGTWFQGRLKPFLPSVSQRSLSCLITKNFTCESYRVIFVELNKQTGLMNNLTQSQVYTDFIRPFLSRQQISGGDCTLPFNNSVDFILQNFGSFSSFAQLQDFYNLSSNFSALEALPVLSLVQLNDLVFTPPARAGDRNEILRRVFDFLLPASNRDKLNNFLPPLQTQAHRLNFSCENYRNIFGSVDRALSSVLPNQTEALLTVRDSLMMIPPDECIERASQCTTTPVNETAVCASVNSSAVDQFLNGVALNATGSQNVCNFSVSQFACLPTLSRLNPQQVADLLVCKLSSNVTKEIWKLFFTKIGTQLDDALQRFSNMTPSPSNFSLSDILDVIVDVRINRFSPQRLRDPVFIGTWFQGRLKPFLPSVSQRSLSCLITKNFTCESYRVIFVELNKQTGLMNNLTQSQVYTDFIRPFLSRQQISGGDCTLPFNNSLDFILQNFGSFSSFAQLQDFYNLSSNFSALEALPVLSLVQLNDLVFTPPARAGDRNEILRRVFDFLLPASNRDKLNNFLPSLQTQAHRLNFSCENYRNIFDRVDWALSSVLPNQTEALLTVRDSLMMIPPDECIERASQCTTTPVNETAVCASVNSSAVDQFLNGVALNATGSQNVCNFSVSQFACLPTLSRLNPQQVADLLVCKLPSNVTKETWKLFFTKIGTQLDDALQRFSNMTPSPSNFSLSDILDVIVDVRINRFSPQRLRDPVFIGTWFQGRLKPFLPSVSQRSLSCLSTKNFTCESYRGIFVELNKQTGLMNNLTQSQVYTDYIRPFLSRQQISGGDCTLPFNNSVDFILQNFGSFSSFAQLQDFYNLSRNFSALDALPVLSLVQLNDLVFTPPARAGDRNEILRRVFDFLLPASNRDKLNNFLPALQIQAHRLNFSCENYRNIFDSVDRALSSVLPNQTEALLTIRDSLMMIPPDECIERASQCTTTPVNETAVCASVNSSAVDQFLNGVALNATGSQNVCNFSVSQFACLPTLSRLNPQQVADLLVCKLSSNVTKEIWKRFFTKIGTQLDDALQRFSNMTPSPSNFSLSDILDVIVDVRINRFSPQRLRDPVFIGTWFQGRLKPFLPSVSQRSLSCLSTKNFTCESYRGIFVELNKQTGLLNNLTQSQVYTDFIRPFLSRQQISGGDCTLPFNNSVDFILQNFGSFSSFAQLQDFYNMSSNFSALEALPVLSLVQLNDLVFTPPARAGDRNEILRRVFDFLLPASNRDKLNNFLPPLQTQARRLNFSCENYRNIFGSVDRALSSVLPNQTEALLTVRDSLMMIPPDECIERAGQCTTTPVNETAICASVNSSAVDQFLNGVALNATGSQNVCNFSVSQFACLPTLSRLNPQQVADLLACKLPSNVTKETWKIFFTKIGTQLDDALQRFSNMTPSPSNFSLSDVLDVIVDIRIDRFSPQRLRDPVFIGTWFQGRLKPFLPSVSQRSLSCLSTKNFTCESYRVIVEAFANVVPQDVCNPLQSTVTQRQDLIYTEFIKAFLSRNDTEDPRCLRGKANSTQWVAGILGPFSQSARLKDLQTLNGNLTAVDVLTFLNVRQLGEFAATPGTLTDLQSVINIMKLVKDCQIGTFFDSFSPAVQDVLLPQDVKAALIQQIFERANLSNITISNEEVVIWINARLKPLLTNLTERLVTPFFTILSARDCNITQTAVKVLDVVRSSMPNNTKNAIYSNILLSFRGPQPLRCYSNNSFITFLNESLLGFGPLPNVSTLLSLIPAPRKTEIVNSIAPSELGTYLRQPEVVDSGKEICFIFKNLVRTPEFMENVEVPDNVKRTILPCVWPLALTSDNQTEVDLWFERRLRLYLKFLNTDILGSNDTLNASCLSYRKMVNVLGSQTINASSGDIYNTIIKTYLKTDSETKCYNANDTRLNSTAWFVNYIGVTFINFVSIDDLYSFGPENTMKTFTVNSENIQLFNQSGLPKKVISRYTELIFLQNPSFYLFNLPSILQCDAPVSVFTKLNESQTNIILGNFKTSCLDVDPQISTALAGNIQTISVDTIQNLGKESVGLTTQKINTAPPSVLLSGLSTLSNVSGWNLGQSQAIVTVLLSGNFQLNSSSSLLSLGSLIGGVPSEKLSAIAPEQLLETSHNPVFIENILAAPEIVQITYVTQIIKVSTSVAALMSNIPNKMAIQIPRSLLTISDTPDVTLVKQFNDKTWKPEQAVLFFDSVANAFSNSDDLSADVLQGFTCSRVQTFSKDKIRGLIKACRRRSGRNKVVLSEPQLTCMYNLIRDDSPLDFANYPTDMLLYYNYEKIPTINCSSYFTEVASADFSVLSSELRGRKDTLWNNAASCFNIKGTSITKKDLTVLGNLTCVLNKDYIENSDPEILENLKSCTDFSDGQMGAMETVLLKGTSKYGPPNQWNQKTLDDLGTLPLHFSQTFWSSFKQNDLNKFLKSFLKLLRGKNTAKPLMKRLFKALIVTTPVTSRAVSVCTKENITSVTISDDAFPFGYDATQFKNCLSLNVTRDNLASLCEKIDVSDFQRIILDQLNEISPNGLSENQVKVLGAVARNATVNEISKWNITKSDTLAALMNVNDGEWTSEQSKQIITNYLSANNNLTATVLNLVKGPNLCSLNSNTLGAILPESIKGADALDVSKCSSDNKKMLFSIAKTAFPISSTRAQSAVLTQFQLIESYLGGADLAYVKNLTSLNISMSLATFMKLDGNVVTNLTVSDVVGLLGLLNLRDLKTYENQTVVRSWISLQLQSELDKLNISLTGGRVETIPPSNSTTNATTVATTVIKVTAGASGIRASEWSFSFTILVLIFTIIKVDIMYSATP